MHHRKKRFRSATIRYQIRRQDSIEREKYLLSCAYYRKERDIIRPKTQKRYHT